jgi:tetratricopeptide (TPR) repeat protein
MNAMAKTGELVRAALAAAGNNAASEIERAEMLMEMAMGLQQRPKSPDELIAAVELYNLALTICPQGEQLMRARIEMRKGTALQAIPEARAAFERAMPDLVRFGGPEEVAEAEMNLGLALQHLAGAGKARITDAIAAYQRALRVFGATRYPVEFAILQNNLATAFLSIPFSDERSKMREALAVQSFEEGLKAVTLIDHPAEYAMLQNNLGNALQYASTSHALANNLRAVEAYDEALKVRNRETTPLEYANTLSNRANCLWNLPDDPERPQAGNPQNMRRARDGYQTAREIFALNGEVEKARMVAEALFELEREIMGLPEAARA